MVERVTIRRRDGGEPPIMDYARWERRRFSWKGVAWLLGLTLIGAIVGSLAAWAYASTVRYTSSAYLEFDVSVANLNSLQQAHAMVVAPAVHDQILSRVRSDSSIDAKVKGKIPDVDVSSVAQTKLVQFRVSGTDAVIARDAANELAEAYAKFLTDAGTPASVTMPADRVQKAALTPYVMTGAILGAVLLPLAVGLFLLLRSRRTGAL